MNICDDPNRVSTSANWRKNDTIRRCLGLACCCFRVQIEACQKYAQQRYQSLLLPQ